MRVLPPDPQDLARYLILRGRGYSPDEALVEVETERALREHRGITEALDKWAKE